MTKPGVTYFCTDSVGHTYSRYSATHIKPEYTWAVVERRPGTTKAVGKSAVQYSRTGRNAQLAADRVLRNGYWNPDTRKAEPAQADVVEVRAYLGRHKTENDAIAKTEGVGGEVPYWNTADLPAGREG
jgi:hypothetical protein